MLSRCLVAAVVAAGLLACKASEPPQSPPSAVATDPGARCGLRLFANPGCQSALDEVCCPLETDCATDPGCARLSQCILACARGGENCSNGCAVRLQHDYCAAACQGQGGDCTTVCMTRREPPPPYTKYALVASCSKGVRYPADVRCGR